LKSEYRCSEIIWAIPNLHVTLRGEREKIVARLQKSEPVSTDIPHTHILVMRRSCGVLIIFFGPIPGYAFTKGG
jgi:hypothetical protein